MRTALNVYVAKFCRYASVVHRLLANSSPINSSNQNFALPSGKAFIEGCADEHQSAVVGASPSGMTEGALRAKPSHHRSDPANHGRFRPSQRTQGRVLRVGQLLAERISSKGQGRS
jgi:hypothetical protein